MSDSPDTRDLLAAAPLGSWGVDAVRYPLAVLPCMGLRYDRYGFPSYPGGTEDE